MAIFGLIYDENNPYFAGCGSWPGWPTVLAEAFAANADPQRFRFASISWQDLAPLLRLDDDAAHWAHEKHALAGRSRGTDQAG
jgi:hypothetical protein